MPRITNHDDAPAPPYLHFRDALEEETMTLAGDAQASAMHPSRLFSCAGQVAIVTGGSSGIGRASVEALAAAGARVLLVGLPGGEPEAAASALRDGGLEVEGLAADLTETGAASALVAAAVDRWGRLDTVVANAGAALDQGGPTDLDALDRMYALHVRSVVELANVGVPVIAESGGGTFLVMSSLAGLRGNRVLAGYGITKAANAQLARNLAVQWGPSGVRANAISPGVIQTEFARPITDDPAAAGARRDRTPLRRFGRVEEVAGAIVWLASSAGAFVTGQNIVIDGGTLVAD
jgi:NAD(P)-dependent dehydrogenase (short-subunit alcohol dehydrogenase family)